MSPLPYEEATRWLARAREALAVGWATSVPGPDGIAINVAHSGQGYATCSQTALELEVAPGVVVDLDELRLVYP